MTVLPWVRLDSGMPENPKIGNVISRTGGYKAVFTYLCALSYSGKHGTYGTIPKAALPFIHGTTKEAKMLVDAGLWIATKTGWEIHDWNTYQPTEEYVRTRKEKARKAARARWDKESEAANMESANGPSPF